MSPTPLSRLVADGRAAGHAVALRNGVPLDFAAFRAQVAAAARLLSDCRSAALVCRDSYNFSVGFLALLHAGADVVLPPNGQPGTLENLEGQFDRLVDDTVIEGAARDGERTDGSGLVPIDSRRLAIHFFTSGSTGNAKRIAKTLGMLEAEVATLDRVWGASMARGPVFATVTHQHLYGLVFKLLWPLSAGRPFAAEMHEVWETLLPDLVPEATVIASPAHLMRLAGITPLPGVRRPGRVFSAGAPLPLAAAAAAEEVFACRPTEIFGSTETGAFATRRQQLGDEPWSLLPGVEMRADGEGLLSLRAPYAGDGWVRTGDLVEPRSGGFRFVARSDRVVKIEGKRVSLPHVEEALAALPWVKDAAVVLLAGEPRRLGAVVVPSDQGREVLRGSGGFRFSRLLRAGLAATQEPAGMPRRWRFVEALPTRSMGKRSDADLAALFAEVG